MRATKTFNNLSIREKIMVTTQELQELLGCGRDSAIRIGEQAEARVNLGRRALWNVKKVSEYVDTISY